MSAYELIHRFVTAAKLALVLSVSPAAAEPICAEAYRQAEDESEAMAGHVLPELDEMIADASLRGKPQAILIDQNGAYFLVVIPRNTQRAHARLTLRPYSRTDTAGGAGKTIELGELAVSDPGSVPIAFVISLADRAALQALAAGAIELETRMHDGVVWSTLATGAHYGPSAAQLDIGK